MDASITGLELPPNHSHVIMTSSRWAEACPWGIFNLFPLIILVNPPRGGARGGAVNEEWWGANSSLLTTLNPKSAAFVCMFSWLISYVDAPRPSTQLTETLLGGEVCGLHPPLIWTINASRLCQLVHRSSITWHFWLISFKMQRNCKYVLRFILCTHCYVEMPLDSIFVYCEPFSPLQN